MQHGAPVPGRRARAASSSTACRPSTSWICGSTARIVFDRFIFDFYVELVNATLSRQVYAITQVGGQPKEESFRIVLPSIGVRGEF